MEEIKNNTRQENIPLNVEEVSNPSKINEVVEVVQKEKGTKGLMTLVFLLLFIVVAMGTYILIREGYFSEKKDTITNEANEIVETEEEQKEDLTETTVFTGKHISAQLPTGWRIVEWENGEGHEYLTQDPTSEGWEGLTGLQILNGEKEIMSLNAVPNFGREGCEELPKFKDYSPELEQEIMDYAKQAGYTLKILDLTNSKYSEYTWLGARVRRVGTTLFEDTIDGEKYFEAQCDQFKIIGTEGPYYNEIGYEKASFYAYLIQSTATEAELNQLDEILESMKLVK